MCVCVCPLSNTHITHVYYNIYMRNLPVCTSCPLFRHVPDAVMKDNDFRGKAKIRLPPSAGDELIEQLYADCTFLADVYGVMDYSLLGG